MVGESEIINIIIVEVEFRPPSIVSQNPPCYLPMHLILKIRRRKSAPRVLIVYWILARW